MNKCNMHDTFYAYRVKTIYAYKNMASQSVTIKAKQVCMKTQHCFLKISQCKWSLLLNVDDYEISSPQLISSEGAKM